MTGSSLGSFGKRTAPAGPGAVSRQRSGLDKLKYLNAWERSRNLPVTFCTRPLRRVSATA